LLTSNAPDFGLASALLLTTMNYLLVGWFADNLDHCYLSSWQILMSLIAVFNVLGHIALAVIRYRTSEKSLLGALGENFKWSPMLSVFFGGLSFHVSTALLAYLFHVDMTWGATSKEKENSNFFNEIPKIFKTFMYMYICIALLTAGMIYLGCFAPRGWEIRDFTAIGESSAVLTHENQIHSLTVVLLVPLAINIVSHALTPLVLNPSLMVFNY